MFLLWLILVALVWLIADTTEVQLAWTAALTVLFLVIGSPKFRIGRRWKKQLNRSDVLILDTETTGLDKAAEVIEVAVIDTLGQPVFEALCLPQSTVEIPRAASAIHGLTRKYLEENGARPWPQVHEELVEVLKPAKTVLAYNVEFDKRLLEQTSRRYRLQFPSKVRNSWRCILKDYRKLQPNKSARLVDAVRREGAKPPRGKAHRALHDCQCVLAVMQSVVEHGARE